MKALLLDGSIGHPGNTFRFLKRLGEQLQGIDPSCSIRILALKGTLTADALNELHQSDLLVIGTGTYWDSWGSPLQRFLEEATESEGSDAWLGKPTGVLVSAHSVGAKGVLSRLQGVLNTYGCLIPPMSGWIYTAAHELALQAPQLSETLDQVRDDLWSPKDLHVVAHNLLAASPRSPSELRGQFKAWDVDRQGFHQVWAPESR